MEALQPFVGRAPELAALRTAMEGAKQGSGSLLLAAGPAGIGKTRFLEEAARKATEAGFLCGSGGGLLESFVLYHPWMEALRPLGLEHLLREEPPPKLLALYLVSGAGLPIVRAERPGFSEDPSLLSMMLNNAGEFLRDAILPREGAAGADLMRLAVGGRGVCIFRAQDFALLAVFDGRETEIFLRDLRRLVEEVQRRSAGRLVEWDGNKRAVQDLEAVPAALMLSGKYDGVDLAADGQARKLNLFDNVLFGLRRKASAAPLIILLDGLQWADPSSLGLLHYVARNTRNAPIVLLGAYRSEEREVRAHLREALEAMEREALPRELKLDALSPADARHFAEALLGPNKLGDEFFERLARDTEGNPMIVREVVRQFVEEGALAPDPADGLVRATRPIERQKVTGKVRDAVAHRLSLLDRADRELLDAAAVCGTRFDGAMLAHLANERELAVQRRLNSIARGHGLIRAEGVGWRFDHPVIREVIYATTAPGLLRACHLEAADYLAKAGAADVEVGEHFAAANDPRGVGPLSAAGDSALVRGAPYEAARMFEKAAAVAAPRDAVELGAKRAAALELSGHYEEALQAISRVSSAGGDRLQAAELKVAVLVGMSRFQEAIQVVDEALALAQGSRAARLLMLRARALNALARYSEAGDAGRLALERVPPAEVRQQAEVLREIGKTSLYLGRFDEALQSFNAALGKWEVAGDRRGMGLAHVAIGSTFGNRGDTYLAIEALRRALVTLEAIGDRSGVAACALNLSEGLADTGAMDEALERARLGHALAESIGSVGLTAFGESMVGYVYARRGEAEQALQWLDKCAARQRVLGARRGLANVLAESVRPRLQLGQTPAALTAAEEALKIARDTNDAPNQALALRARGEVAGAMRDADGMRAYFGQADEAFQRLGQTKEIAENHARWAQAAQAASFVEEAKVHWSKAAELFEERKLPLRAQDARAQLDSLRD